MNYRGSVTEAEKTTEEIRTLGDCLPIRADLTMPDKIEFLFSPVDEFQVVSL
ncbi:MAG: hypothetical protein HYU84_13070 [Chloroflexi bacterium]|nr:hypothetical protein [Chloroflexota bacterium]